MSDYLKKTKYFKLLAVSLLLFFTVSFSLVMAEEEAPPETEQPPLETLECTWLAFDEENPEHAFGFRCLECHSQHKADLEKLLKTNWENYDHGDGKAAEGQESEKDIEGDPENLDDPEELDPQDPLDPVDGASEE